MVKKEVRLPYFQTESFGAVDGPGIRFVVFSQGCFYRCLYCHNPESWQLKKDVKTLSVDDIINQYKRHITFYKNGGITLSGGDPLIHLDFCIAMAKRCYEEKISLALDTSGVNFIKENEKKFKEICKYNPLWIVDVKQINPAKHEILTKVKEQREINLIKFLDKNHQKMWIRQVLVPGYTDDPKDLEALGAFISKIKGLKHFQILPYHNLALDKYKKLGIDYPLKNTPVPTAQDLENAKEYIKKGFYKQ